MNLRNEEHCSGVDEAGGDEREHDDDRAQHGRESESDALTQKWNKHGCKQNWQM